VEGREKEKGRRGRGRREKEKRGLKKRKRLYVKRALEEKQKVVSLSEVG
jgi:hypothetical protein